MMASSNLLGCSYDDETRELTVEFRNGVYVYTGVPREIYEGLDGALSPGRYFYANIRDVFPFRRG